LTPSVREELGEEHLAVFVHELVERLDLKQFEAEPDEIGLSSYPPQLLLKVWLYAYALGVTSSRRIEQRIREDLGFRLLAGNLKPDHWTLNKFRRRHPRALNDVFTQVVEAGGMGLGRLGRGAIDSTRVDANTSPDRSDSIEQLRRERARIRQRIRRWQQQCDQDDSEPSGGQAPAPEGLAAQTRSGFHRNWNSCVNRDNSAVHVVIRRAAICASGAASAWGIRRKWRCPTIT
jgi:transposase